jgi:hypothetical protein
MAYQLGNLGNAGYAEKGSGSVLKVGYAVLAGKYNCLFGYYDSCNASLIIFLVGLN